MDSNIRHVSSHLGSLGFQNLVKCNSYIRIEMKLKQDSNDQDMRTLISNSKDDSGSSFSVDADFFYFIFFTNCRS